MIHLPEEDRHLPMTFVPNCRSYFCAVTCSFGDTITPLGSTSSRPISRRTSTHSSSGTHALLIRTCSWLSFLKMHVLRASTLMKTNRNIREELLHRLTDCKKIRKVELQENGLLPRLVLQLGYRFIRLLGAACREVNLRVVR